MLPRDPDFIRLIFILRLLSADAAETLLTDSVKVAVADPPPAAGTFKVAPAGSDPEINKNNF